MLLAFFGISSFVALAALAAAYSFRQVKDVLERILCGDARESASFSTLLESWRAQLVFIDPPFNVPIDGHATGLGRTKHREFEVASGEMTEAEFIAFLTTVLRHLAQFSVNGAVLYVAMDRRHYTNVRSGLLLLCFHE